ncbi:general odorant-binding protein 99b-like [Anopheles funestus]|uniref:general odorant-binding protein 99b-like n=1 Tax=Anopheles funestus TaxID=62324 RepID=UPI0020C69621|nr:general odorant-binding protein 99b-like [Anopheles funestus]
MKSIVLLAAVLTVLSVQLVRATDDIESLIDSCSKVVEGMTEDLKARYRANAFPDDPVTHCFVRCLGLTLNLYDDEEGVDLHANWEYLGKVDDEIEFIAKHRDCLDNRNLALIDNPCDRAYSAFQCLKEEYGMDQSSSNSTSST